MSKFLNNKETSDLFVFPKIELVNFEKSGINADVAVTSTFEGADDDLNW